MEEWKQTEHPDYWVSNLGRVKSCKFDKERILKSYFSNQYLQVWITSKKKKSVHRLVAEAFISNPLNLKEIDHINQIKTDNQLENLRWVTRSENMINKPDRTQHRNIKLYKNRWRVQIYRDWQLVYYESFKTLEEAQVNRDIWLLFQ